MVSSSESTTTVPYDRNHGLHHDGGEGSRCSQVIEKFGCRRKGDRLENSNLDATCPIRTLQGLS